MIKVSVHFAVVIVLLNFIPLDTTASSMPTFFAPDFDLSFLGFSWVALISSWYGQPSTEYSEPKIFFRFWEAALRRSFFLSVSETWTKLNLSNCEASQTSRRGIVIDRCPIQLCCRVGCSWIEWWNWQGHKSLSLWRKKILCECVFRKRWFCSFNPATGITHGNNAAMTMWFLCGRKFCDRPINFLFACS